MARIDWDKEPSFYDLGLGQGVLYTQNKHIVWNGLLNMETIPPKDEQSSYYDGSKRLQVELLGDYEAKVEAFTYPDILDEYAGPFDFTYCERSDSGTKIHLVYNAFFYDTARNFTSVRHLLEPSAFSWKLVACPTNLVTARPTSHIFVDSNWIDPDTFRIVEEALYGTDQTEPRMPRAEELITLFDNAAILKITQNGDGTYTASGPNHIVQLEPDGRFTITAPTLHYYDSSKFVVGSY